MIIPRNKANALLREYNLKDLRGIELEDIVSLKKIFYEETNLRSCQASIISSINYSKITVDAQIKNLNQKRFAIAHELGHYILHRGGNQYFSDDEKAFYKYHQKGNQESEANEFAAELLMPRSRFEEFTVDKDFDINLIKETSRRFETSITSTSIKYSNFGHEPIALIFTQDGIIKWKSINVSFPFSFLRSKLPVPQYSSVNDYYKSGTKVASCVVVDAFNWFYEDYAIDKYPKANLYEQVFYIDSINSALVYLWIKHLK